MLFRSAQGFPPHRLVSRISAVTGLNRREVTRLTQVAAPRPLDAGASLGSQVFTRWVSDPLWQEGGRPAVLPRQGPVRSFEALARSVTQDVHPRAILDELSRLHLAHWDDEADTVALLEEAFTPHDDLREMLSFLGLNVGDHLQAAVDNVLSSESLNFEQSVFAHGLPADAAEALRTLARKHWKALMAEAVPMLEGSIVSLASP